MSRRELGRVEVLSRVRSRHLQGDPDEQHEVAGPFRSPRDLRDRERGSGACRDSPLYEKSLKVSAFWLFTAARIPEVARVGVDRVLSWIATGQLRLHIGLKLPLAQAAEAHRRMEARETVGKILIP